MTDLTLSESGSARHAGRLDRWQQFVEGAIAVVNVVALLAGMTLCLKVVDGTPQLLLAAFLVLFGPGSGLVQLVGSFDTTVRVVLVVGLSVATSTLLAQILLTLGSISLLTAAIPLTIITALGVLLRLSRLANPAAEKIA